MKTPKTRGVNLVSIAEGAAAVVESWADLSNFLFNPENGLITKAYPTKKERSEFQKTAEYKKIRTLLAHSMAGKKLVTGANPQKSGKFVLRLPRTLHSILQQEALQEGTSLNQLVVYKLSAQIKPSVVEIISNKQPAPTVR